VISAVLVLLLALVPLTTRRPPASTLFPYTTLFRSGRRRRMKTRHLCGVIPRRLFAERPRRPEITDGVCLRAFHVRHPWRSSKSSGPSNALPNQTFRVLNETPARLGTGTSTPAGTWAVARARALAGPSTSDGVYLPPRSVQRPSGQATGPHFCNAAARTTRSQTLFRSPF